jgi:DNA-binding NtrC family response regulator
MQAATGVGAGRQARVDPERGASGPPAGGGGQRRFLGVSQAAQRVRLLVARFARSRASVLVTGETGTGKEVVARALHEASGRRPWVAAAVTEIAEGLVESELFGHERGAFTGALARHTGLLERADGGTLFLDEIGDAPLGLQGKLLRALEDGEVRPVGAEQPRCARPRLVTATHRDLGALVRAGRFRRDLYYRIVQTRIEIPPLSERREDVEPIGLAILAELLCASGHAVPEVAPGFFDVLGEHPWPGNVRELRSVLQSALLWWDGRSPLGPELLFEASALALDAGDASLRTRMLDAYRAARGNQEAARRRLGMTRSQWRHRWERLGLSGFAGGR